MAKLTEEQRRERAAKRAVRAALDAEAEDQRRRERDDLWKREGMYLSWAEYVAGEPCRGCGQPLTDDHGDRPAHMKTSEPEKRDHDEEEREFRKRHPECRDGRWTIQGSRVTHCFFCCPPAPLGPKQIEGLKKIFASAPTHEQRKKDLIRWDLTLRCGHVVPHIQHRDSTYVSARVIDCSECGERRGMVKSEQVGPAYGEDGSLHEPDVAERKRLAEELAAAEAKLARQQKNAAATQHRIKEIQGRLGD